MKRNRKKTKGWGLRAALLSLFILVVAPSGWADSLSFYQLDVNVGDGPVSYTDWGRVDFTFSGQDPIYYFNLSVNGTWQVQNIPVLSISGTGVSQTMSYFFSLGNTVGTPVTTINYGYSFTNDVIGGRPAETGITSVVTDTFDVFPGLWDVDVPAGAFKLEEAKPLVGGKAASPVKHVIEGMPNQEAGKNECVPAAVSNSLNFLKDKRGLKVPGDKITIPEMKKAVAWKEDGAPMDTWWQTKKKYMEDNKIPVTTRKITDMAQLVAEVDAKQDIEIIESWYDSEKKKKVGHATVLVGITPLENGDYSLDVVDDTKQGKPGGTNNPRTYVYDHNLLSFYEVGVGWTKFEYAVVECPVPEPASAALLGFGVLGLLGGAARRRRR